MQLRFQQPPATDTSACKLPPAMCGGRSFTCLALALVPAFTIAGDDRLLAGIPPDNLSLPDADKTETLQMALSIGYESLFIASGMQSAYGSLQTNAELAWYSFTAGAWANNPLDAQGGNPAGPFGPEYRFYGSHAVALTGQLGASLGFTAYTHPRKGSTPNRHREINLGLSADVPLEPELIYNYDFDLQQHDVALAVSCETALDPWLPLEGLGLSAGLLFGYLHADRPESNQAPDPQNSLSYVYTEVAVNLVYTHKEALNFYAGPRFASNNSADGNIAGRRSNFWWGAGCRIAF